jgi:hypothetical protein
MRLFCREDTYAVGALIGGLAGRVPSGCPSKNHCFLVVAAGFAGNNHQKVKISGRQRLPAPLHSVSRVNE